MSYCIEVDLVNVRVLNVSAAVAALASLPRHRYSWVDSAWNDGISEGLETPEALVQALRGWRYEASIQGGEVTIEYFTGQKQGECHVLWSAISPFATGSILFEGEDGYEWGYKLGAEELRRGTCEKTWTWE
jgi:hypothetical protein